MNLDEGVAGARASLAEAGRRPAVVGHDLWITSGLEQALPETVLLCLQRCSAVDLLRERGVDVFCLSEAAGVEAAAGKSSLDLLTHPATKQFCARTGALALIAFKPSERIAAAAADLGAQLLAGGFAAARAAENKLAFIAMAERAGVPTPRWRELTLTPDVSLELPVVLQGARGNAGRRTYLIEEPADLEKALKREAGGPVRVAEFVDGLPFTATGLSGGGEDALKSWIEPCRQVTGVPWLTPEPLGSCGNTWHYPGLGQHKERVGAILRALAWDLVASGYSGPFGVDFVLADRGPVVIEVNPRVVASLPVATQLEVAAGRAPLLLQHLRQALGAELAAERPEPRLLDFSQVIVHSLESDGTQGIASGVYKVAGGREPKFARPGVWISDLRSADEVLVLCRDAGEPRTLGREFARVYFKGASGEDQPGVRETVEALRRR